MVRRIFTAALIFLLGAFFAFVGWNKAFASLADLAIHGAWTVHLPELAGRLVGWSEMACAAALLIPRTRFWAALILIVNQLAAAGIHGTQAELSALPQNAVLIGLLTLLAFITRPAATAAREAISDA